MKIYYAHCIGIYNTKQEARDVKALEALGFEVVNPNCAECDEGYRVNGMAFFENWPFYKGCTAMAFRSLPDGSVPAGVAKEIEIFTEKDYPVIELPSSVGRRTLTKEQTRDYLRESGHR